MIGELILDRFRLGECLGKGGAGAVYRAWDERLGRPVAVKVLDQVDPGRIEREAQAAARLNHPAIATLYELGTEGERSYLVSELVEGATLRELLDRGRISDREVAEVGIDICEAIGHAHQRNVIHRDIKPENIIVRPPPPGGGRTRTIGGRGKLTDFGIAQLRDKQTLTAPEAVLGTLAYMSPEQAEGGDVGPAGDLYALVLTLFQAWVGENPVEDVNPAATVRNIGSELPSLADYRPDLPRGLVRIVDAGIAAEPSLRPSSGELAEALLAAIADLTHDPVPDPIETFDEAAEPPLDLGRGVLLVAVIVATMVPGFAGLYGLATVAALLGGGLVFAAAPVRFAAVPALAVGLASTGCSAAIPALCAAAPTNRSRVTLASLCVVFVLSAAALGLIDSSLIAVLGAPEHWEKTFGGGVDLLSGAMIENSALVLIALWAAGAVVLVMLRRIREPASAILAGFGWSAAMVALQRTLTDPESVAGAAPAVVLIVAVYVVADIREVRRAARSARNSARRGTIAPIAMIGPRRPRIGSTTTPARPQRWPWGRRKSGSALIIKG